MRKQITAVLSVLALTSASALAEEPRKIDFSAVITDHDGRPYQECLEWQKPVTPQSECSKSIELTLGQLALAGLVINDQGVSGAEQVKRQALGLRIFQAKDAELTSDEITLVREQIGKVHYRGIATLRAWKLLDPASVK